MLININFVAGIFMKQNSDHWKLD